MGCERQVREAAALVELDELRGDHFGVLKVSEVCLPVKSLLVKEADEVEQFGIAISVVEPENAERFVLPAELAPIPQGSLRQLGILVGVVTLHEGDDTRVAGSFLILGEHLEHNESRPPVVVPGGPHHAVRRLMGQRPVNIFLSLRFEPSVAEKIGEWHESV